MEDKLVVYGIIAAITIACILLLAWVGDEYHAGTVEDTED